MCTGNTISADNFNCAISGYKQKVNYDALSGNTVGLCCDRKFCSDFSCAARNKKAKSNPTQPAEGNEPTEAGCCEAITGMCTGNTLSNENVNCGWGYKPMADYDSRLGTKVEECCDQKTCSHHTCAARRELKSNPTQPSVGNEPTEADCCEDVTGMCSGNWDAATDVTCHAEKYWKDKPGKASIVGASPTACCDPILGQCLSLENRHVSYECPVGQWAHPYRVCEVASRTPVDCVNDNFDVVGIAGQAAAGPICPAAGGGPGTPTSDPNDTKAATSTTVATHAVAATFPAMMVAIAFAFIPGSAK